MEKETLNTGTSKIPQFAVDSDSLVETALFFFFSAMVCRIYTSVTDPRWLIIVAIGILFATWFLVNKFVFPNLQKIRERGLPNQQSP